MITTTERIYSLKTAAALIGSSEGRFRYNRDKLVQAGVVITEDGWRIPHSALVAVGWVDPRATIPALPLTRVEQLELRIKELEVENERLREEASRPRLFGRRR